MFCKYCGAKNEDDAVFCVSCGKQMLGSTPGEQAPTQPSHPVPTQPFGVVPSPPSPKNPTVAAILNLLPGVGYWYWGYQKVATIPPLLLFVIVIVVEFVMSMFLPYGSLIALAIGAFFAYDLWVKTTGQRGWIEASI